MNQFANAFSLLEVDVADDREQTDSAVPTVHQENANERARGEEKGDSSGETILTKSDSGCQQPVEMVSGEYKLPLVWIDLEMTGLNVEVDRILEIACVVTDGNLSKSIEGPDLVIYQSKECLDRMGEWCQTHHAASGLTEKVLQSTTGEQEAEKQKYMPDLASLFYHVIVDVSSVRALCFRWYPKENRKAPAKENKHRAMDDIRESIAELKYLKANIFKPSKQKK
ncbi:oligoribonuclease-like isoform X2 [Rhododendron vialii]|uniref:oligoribonuclease-like isoform X2 n=1 Tax=Rhododendron vialii TaxID=182163 RepID=UPI00265EE94F|nr:oligoribonuclease-like isoform X2 [Rhododendron vialii]